MTGPCCVDGCIACPEDIYFEFPTSGILRRKWLEVIPIKGKLPLGTVVCSQHFNKDEYETVRGKVRLKSKVVPSLHLDVMQKRKETVPKIYPVRKSKRKTSKVKETSTSNDDPSPQTDAPSTQKDDLQNQEPTPLDRDSPSKIYPSGKKTDPTQKDVLPTEKDVLPESDDRPIQDPTPKVYPPALKDVPSTENDVPTTENDVPTTKNDVPSAEKDVPSAQKVDLSSQRVPSSDKSDTVIATDPNVIKDNGRVRNTASSNTDPDPKEDIEDMIVNYQIKNKFPNPALLPEVDAPSLPQSELPQDCEMQDAIDLLHHKEQPPVFIEISVDGDKTTNDGGESSQDCLMVLESVQCEVDPTTLMLDPDFEPEEEKAPDKNENENPISLLTSSDEDDVILQEPEIDTVEVSDETDEDDMPLVKLVKPVKKTQKLKTKKKLKKRSKLKKSQAQAVNNIAWGVYDFYCMQCHFSTKDSGEYRKHVNEHSTILQVCPVCGYTSASKTMFARHSRKHKEEKKYKCHLCDYRAKHNMSLIYHLQSHNGTKVRDKNGYHCKKCGFYSDMKGAMLRHVRVCESVVYSCDNCNYVTKRRSDLKRHVARRHRENVEEDEWLPSVEVD